MFDEALLTISILSQETEKQETLSLSHIKSPKWHRVWGIFPETDLETEKIRMMGSI